MDTDHIRVLSFSVLEPRRQRRSAALRRHALATQLLCSDSWSLGSKAAQGF